MLWIGDLGSHILRHFVSVFQFPNDVAGEMVFDLGMARNRLTGMGSRILIPIVSAAMPNEHTSHALDLSHEFPALHAS